MLEAGKQIVTRIVLFAGEWWSSLLFLVLFLQREEIKTERAYL